MISAIIVAAGESKRMGRPKMLLPWGEITVIQQVMLTFRNAGVQDILVVTGGARQEVEKLVEESGSRGVFNPEYANGEMLSSIQCGLMNLWPQTQAALIGLGDQPQVQERNVRLICEAFEKQKSRLVVPSYQMRRGHPWLLERSLWNEMLQMKRSRSPREFLHQHADEIQYVNVDDASILVDLDTPEDYQKSRP